MLLLLQCCCFDSLRAHSQQTPTKDLYLTHFASTLLQFDTSKQTRLKPLCRGLQKLNNFFASLFLSSFFFSLFFLLFLFFLSLYSAFSKCKSTAMSSLKNPSLIGSSSTVIPFNGDLHSLRDHPSLFCMLRLSMAIFLSISEQKIAHKILSPPTLYHYMVEAALPGDPSPAPLPTHPHSLTFPALCLQEKVTFHNPTSAQRMRSTSADELPAQSYNTAKHFPHQLRGVRSCFTPELSHIRQTDRQQGHIHVGSTHRR